MDYEFEPRSIFGIETRRAERRLRRKFQSFPWYISVGAHGGPNQAGLIVYVNSDDHKEIDSLKSYRGFSVRVENVSATWKAIYDKKRDRELEWLP